MLIHIANLRTPMDGGFLANERAKFFRLLREKTQAFWPALWAPANENEPVSETEERALRSVVRFRGYLRIFWTEADPRTRDWYIHRAREHYQRHFVLTEARETRKSFENAHTAEDARIWAGELNKEMEALLDKPPQRNWVEDALFELQELARYPSKSPLYCKNPDCEKPYFLSEKKGMKFCSLECSQTGIRASKRKSWSSNKTKWRSK